MSAARSKSRSIGDLTGKGSAAAAAAAAASSSYLAGGASGGFGLGLRRPGNCTTDVLADLSSLTEGKLFFCRDFADHEVHTFRLAKNIFAEARSHYNTLPACYD